VTNGKKTLTLMNSLAFKLREALVAKGCAICRLRQVEERYQEDTLIERDMSGLCQSSAALCAESW
jgi:hypothetical protein